MRRSQDIPVVSEGSVPSPFVELQHSLASHTAAISPFVDQLMHFIRMFIGRFQHASESEDDIETALREALANAVIHGNHQNPRKQVDISCRISLNGDVTIMVRDDGDGFNYHSVPDPTDLHHRLLAHGRGIHLMKALMDDVRYEEGGKVVRLRKQIFRPGG